MGHPLFMRVEQKAKLVPNWRTRAHHRRGSFSPSCVDDLASSLSRSSMVVEAARPDLTLRNRVYRDMTLSAQLLQTSRDGIERLDDL